MKARIIMSIIVTIIFACATAVAVENQGAKDITLDGGKKGNVNFPHHLHQNAIGSCNACHDLFPKTAGTIKDFKEQGKLKKMQVMNKICIECHKLKEKAGEKAGPTKCAQCHVK